MKFLSLLLILFVFQITYSQENLKLNKFNFDYENTIFHLTQQSWKANQKPSTGSVPYVTPIEERKIPLQAGEGENSNLYLLEADLNLMFPLFWGRKDRNGGSFSKLNLLTFDYGFNFRMTLDDSKPLTPASNRVGLSWSHNLFNNYSGWSFLSYGREITDEKFLIKENDFRFINTLIQVHHYSNGQSGPSNIFFKNLVRNNYKDGDFSTNYIYGQISFGKYSLPSFALTQLSLGYRYDFELGDALSFSEDQNLAYGKHSIKFIFDRWSAISELPIFCSKVSYHTRLETKIIVDNLKNFQPNNNSEKNYRWSVRALFEISPKINRSIGYFISAHYGRDYLNIRYDDIVFVSQVGVTLSLDKYKANYQSIAKKTEHNNGYK